MGCSGRVGGVRRPRMGRLVLALAMVLFGPALGMARAAEIETRDFVVLVAGKRAGEVHMTIERHLDGKRAGEVDMRCETDINVKGLTTKYRFSFRGLEVWKDKERRLVRFDSTTDDNGMRYVISAAAEAGGVKLRVNNVERTVRPDIWLSSYWRLPEPKQRGQVLPIVDADDGKNIDSRLAFVAMEERVIAGQRVTVQRWRLSGKVNIDLWYDGQERLVHQEWVEQGHKTTLELVRVRR